MQKHAEPNLCSTDRRRPATAAPAPLPARAPGPRPVSWSTCQFHGQLSISMNWSIKTLKDRFIWRASYPACLHLFPPAVFFGWSYLAAQVLDTMVSIADFSIGVCIRYCDEPLLVADFGTHGHLWFKMSILYFIVTLLPGPICVTVTHMNWSASCHTIQLLPGGAKRSNKCHKVEK